MILWNDLTAVPIVTAVNVAEAERFAAEELRSYLSRISGRTFKIRTAPGPDIPAIFIGRDACISAGLVPDPDLTDDGFVIDCDDRRLCITGIHPRGTLYGVYAFLEDCLGCRFFSPEVETIPCLEAFALSPVHIRKVPALEYRSSSVFQLRDPLYAIKRGINGQDPQQIPEPADAYSTGSPILCTPSAGIFCVRKNILTHIRSTLRKSAGSASGKRPSCASPIPTCCAL